ncbi:MAG: hypothetical protein ACPG6B_09530 [Oceanihabitans sp.]
MNKLFINQQITFLIKLIAMSLIMFGAHSYLCFHFAKDAITFFPLWHIYLFHLATTAIVFTIINYKASTNVSTVFNAFILGMLIKMILAMVFLLPWILSKPENKGLDLANFFIPYFLFLFFEVISITKILNKNQ